MRKKCISTPLTKNRPIVVKHRHGGRGGYSPGGHCTKRGNFTFPRPGDPAQS